MKIDWCNGKKSGLWCRGKELVRCLSGQTKSIADCKYGCQANAPGVPDTCKPPTGFCSNKANGKWCDGNKLLTCKGKEVTGEGVCPFGCHPQAAGVDDKCQAPPTWCDNKSDAIHCDNNVAVTCKNGKEVAKKPCTQGCGELGSGKGAGCLAPVLDAFCGPKSDGTWCGDGGMLVSCVAGKKKKTTLCTNGCDGKGPGGDDECKPPKPADDCKIKADGMWCMGQLLRVCAAGKTVLVQACLFGCVGTSGVAGCKSDPKPQQDFCEGKPNGLSCNNNVLTTCSNGVTSAAKLCTLGCIATGDSKPDLCKEPPFCPGKPDGTWCNGDKVVTCKDNALVTSTVCAHGCVQDGSAVCKDNPDAGAVGDASPGSSDISEGPDASGTLSDSEEPVGLDGQQPADLDSFDLKKQADPDSGCAASATPAVPIWMLLLAVFVLLYGRLRGPNQANAHNGPRAKPSGGLLD